MSRIAIVIRSIIARPALSLGLLAAVIVALFLISTCAGNSDNNEARPTVNNPEAASPGDNSPSAEQQEELPGVPEEDLQQTDRITPAPDPYDYDPEVRGEIERQLSEQPAMQHTPLDRNGVYADLTDILPDGRLLITVEYKTSKQLAQQEWRQFLRQHKDPGSNYVVVYQER